MKTYRATVTTTEIFDVTAEDKDTATLLILEDLSDEQRGTADIELEEIEE
jgi:hypothetical protein